MKFNISKNQERIIKAYTKIAAKGQMPTSAAVAKIAKVSKETARVNVIKLKSARLLK
jgi:hypothetical protein